MRAENDHRRNSTNMQPGFQPTDGATDATRSGFHSTDGVTDVARLGFQSTDDVTDTTKSGLQLRDVVIADSANSYFQSLDGATVAIRPGFLSTDGAHRTSSQSTGDTTVTGSANVTSRTSYRSPDGATVTTRAGLQSTEAVNGNALARSTGISTKSSAIADPTFDRDNDRILSVDVAVDGRSAGVERPSSKSSTWNSLRLMTICRQPLKSAVSSLTRQLNRQKLSDHIRRSVTSERKCEKASLDNLNGDDIHRFGCCRQEATDMSMPLKDSLRSRVNGTVNHAFDGGDTTVGYGSGNVEESTEVEMLEAGSRRDKFGVGYDNVEIQSNVFKCSKVVSSSQLRSQNSEGLEENVQLDKVKEIVKVVGLRRIASEERDATARGYCNDEVCIQCNLTMDYEVENGGRALYSRVSGVHVGRPPPPPPLPPQLVPHWNYQKNENVVTETKSGSDRRAVRKTSSSEKLKRPGRRLSSSKQTGHKYDHLTGSRSSMSISTQGRQMSETNAKGVRRRKPPPPPKPERFRAKPLDSNHHRTEDDDTGDGIRFDEIFKPVDRIRIADEELTRAPKKPKRRTTSEQRRTTRRSPPAVPVDDTDVVSAVNRIVDEEYGNESSAVYDYVSEIQRLPVWWTTSGPVRSTSRTQSHRQAGCAGSTTFHLPTKMVESTQSVTHSYANDIAVSELSKIPSPRWTTSNRGKR